MTQPTKESKASISSIDANLTTLREEIAKKGGDWCEVVKQRARELKALPKALGVPIAAIINQSGGNTPEVDNQSLLEKLEEMETATEGK